MSCKFLWTSLAVCSMGLLGLATAAAPPSSSGGKPPAAAPAGPATGSTTTVHSQAGVNIPVNVFLDGSKTLKAGDYDITLLQTGAAGGKTEFRFEFRNPGSDALLGTLAQVKASVLPSRGAGKMLDPPRSRRPQPPASESSGEPQGEGDSPAKPRQPIIAKVEGGTVRIAYWEKTSLGTIRMLAAMATVQPEGGR